MKKIWTLALVALAFSQIALAQTGKNIEFRNGLWFNGKDFAEGTWYSKNGVFSHKAPSKIDSVVDLGQRWVIPPMADANVSCLAGNPSAREVLKSYLTEGIFYLQILANTKQEREALEPLVNRPDAPLALFANGGITCTLGKPFDRFEPRALDMNNPEMARAKYNEWKNNRRMLGNGYWFLDSKEELDANWPKILAAKPGAISIYLLDAESNGGKEGFGLTPDVAKAVVKKAKKADLQVVAHIQTLADLRLGIKLGVHQFANLPASEWDGTTDAAGVDLTADDLKQLAKKKIAVTPLLAHGQGAGMVDVKIKDFHKNTLKRLVEAGVPIAIGSDDASRTVRSELNYWVQLGALTAPQILKILTETTPQTLLPQRKVGKIEDGYEASFLALSDNPLGNIMKVRLIGVKVKNGLIIK